MLEFLKSDLFNGILALVCIIGTLYLCGGLKLFRRKTVRRKVWATYHSPGKIVITGDADLLQMNMFRVNGGGLGTWERHNGYWLYYTGNDNEEHTHILVSSINISDL